MNINRLFITIFCLLAVMAAPMANAVQIVRLQMEYGGDGTATRDYEFPKVMRTLDLELYDDVTPLTVANFLNYVNDGRYDGMFVHRSNPGFVIQMGGYTFRPANPDTDEFVPEALVAILGGVAATPIPQDAPVLNEFSLSNVRGTLAMAKLGGDPDSATSEWFINMGDNSASLDAQNGGFTVFGNVIDNGMVSVADEISDLPAFIESKLLLDNEFAKVPVADFDITTIPDPDPTPPDVGVYPDPLYQKHLVMITSATSSITRPIVRFTPASGDLGINVVDGVNVVNVQLRNTGNEDLDITGVNAAGLAAPFSMLSEDCTTVVTLDPVSLSPTSSCTINLVFSPAALGVFNDGITVDYKSNVDGKTFSVTYNIFGEGVQDTPVLSVSTGAIAFGNVFEPGGSANKTLKIQNRGGGALSIDAFTIGGISPDEFSRDLTGCSVGSSLSVGESCEVSLNFNPAVRTVSEATIAWLKIDTNTESKTVTMTGWHVTPKISVPTGVLEVGYAEIGEAILGRIFLDSVGGFGGLLIENISFTGVDAAFFTQINNCPSSVSGTPIRNGETCEVRIEFTPTSAGIKFATMVIESNDPDNPIANIDFSGGKEPLISVPASLDVGVAQIGQTIRKDMVVTNLGGPGLRIDSIDFTGVDKDLFMQSTNCPDLIPDRPRLLTDEPCGIRVSFTPDAGGNRTATLVIGSNDPNNPFVYVDLSARVDMTAIQVPSTFSVVSEVNGYSTSRDLIVRNTGAAPLDISGVTGLGVSGLSQTNDCVTSVPAGGTCVITIKYVANIFGQNSATLTIDSNDLVYPSIDVVVTGYGQSDSDGVSDSTELAAPNQGDGNNDEIKDNIQNNVVSFVTAGGKYITLVSDDAPLTVAAGGDGTTVIDSILLVDTVPDNAPTDMFLDYGLFGFNVNLPRGDAVNVALFFPVDATPESYFRYGPTPDDPAPHWYDFSYDNATGIGAQFLGKVTVSSPSGTGVERNMLMLTFIDGFIGDDDLTRNGKIVHGVGGASFDQQPAASDDTAGSAAYLWFAMLILLMRARRLRGQTGFY